MRLGAGAYRGEPILVDRARTFGSFGPGSRARAHGTLVLTEDALRFHPHDGEGVVEIPLEAIRHVGIASPPRGGGERIPMLRVTYSGNLLFGAAVERPDRWINAIRALTGRGDAAHLAAPPRVSRKEMRGFRLFAAVVLLVAILLGVALPLLFSRLHGRTPGEPESPAPQAEAVGW